METKITLPLDCDFKITEEAGMRVITFNPVKENPALEVGKWITGKSSNDHYLIIDDKTYCILRRERGFELFTNATTPQDASLYKPADMQEVKKLLIKEADMRGFKKGVKYENTDGYKRVAKYDAKIHIDSSLICGCLDGLIFNDRTGKWAEIVEEKKPLYTNSFGTEFFEGDEYWFIVKTSCKIKHGSNISDIPDTMCESNCLTEVMTKKECYQYLADHCEE